MVKRIMGRPRQEECSPQDNALGLMHLRRLFSELCHPPRHMTQKEQEEKLYMMLPVFNRVSHRRGERLAHGLIFAVYRSGRIRTTHPSLCCKLYEFIIHSLFHNRDWLDNIDTWSVLCTAIHLDCKCWYPLNLTCPHSRKIKKVIRHPYIFTQSQLLLWNICDGICFFCCCLKGVAATETRKQLQTIVLFIDNRTKLKTKFFSLYYVVVYEASSFFLSWTEQCTTAHAACGWLHLDI